jgi:hypothetical protein
VGAGIGVNAAQMRARIAERMASADRAAKEGRHAEARDAYGEVRALQPGHPLAEARFHEMDRAALAASRKNAAAQFVEEGRRAKDEYDRMQRDLGGLNQEEKRLSTEIEPHAGPEKKAPLWAVRRKIKAVEEAMTLRYQDIVVAFISALGADPDTREAKEALARHYFAEIGFAELEGDRSQAMMYEKMVRLFDQGEFTARLAREGTLALETDPPGAQVELLRYQEGEDLRLLPVPVRSLGTTPVPPTKVEMGSYLLTLKKEGFRDVRYPVSIARGKNHAARVTLYTENEIGEGFTYVPAGEFARGGDPQALSGADAQEIFVDGFFISTSEVGSDLYLQFLNDRSVHTADQAWKRSPRESAGGGQYWLREGDRFGLPKGWEHLPATGSRGTTPRPSAAGSPARGGGRTSGWRPGRSGRRPPAGSMAGFSVGKLLRLELHQGRPLAARPAAARTPRRLSLGRKSVRGPRHGRQRPGMGARTSSRKGGHCGSPAEDRGAEPKWFSFEARRGPAICPWRRAPTSASGSSVPRRSAEAKQPGRFASKVDAKRPGCFASLAITLVDVPRFWFP